MEKKSKEKQLVAIQTLQVLKKKNSVLEAPFAVARLSADDKVPVGFVGCGN